MPIVVCFSATTLAAQEKYICSYSSISGTMMDEPFHLTPEDAPELRVPFLLVIDGSRITASLIDGTNPSLKMRLQRDSDTLSWQSDGPIFLQLGDDNASVIGLNYLNIKTGAIKQVHVLRVNDLDISITGVGTCE